MAEADKTKSKLPLKPIPGSYGTPFFTPIKDRLEYYYFQGQEQFFQSRISKYNSTVFRVNMPPGPFLSSNPRVIAVLDAKTFPVLFNTAMIEKKDVLTGTYVPSTSLTGGFRVLAYLDPSEPHHSKLKQLVFHLLAARKSHFIPSFLSSYSSLFDALELQLRSSGKSEFNKLNQETSFDFICRSFFDVAPSATALGSSGASKSIKWLLLQLHPLITLGIPMLALLEEIFLHSFPLPAFIAKSDYKALYKYFLTAGTTFIDEAEKMGISREEACHNLLFAGIFNAYGGIKVFLPGLLKWVSSAGPELHDRLAREIWSVVRSDGGSVTAAGLERMELTKSVVWEALRIDPPVQYQYGKAKRDMVIESHDAAFEVKKGEMVFGFQPIATRDERVFKRGGEFVAERFVGEEGRRLLKYVVWSNGPETEAAAVGNKQCPGKEVVVMVGRLLLVVMFLRYDTFTAEVKSKPLESGVTVTSVRKAAAVDG